MRAFSSLRMFDYEDVTIGAWMLAMNVKHEDNRAMCDSICTPTSIAVWDSKKCSGLSSNISLIIIALGKSESILLCNIGTLLQNG